ncbi:hypothetical protein EV363DRAFT_1429508 [Boletus edulis]|nr:hypothetical protein EV363DRAFT_1429508 [Boletus edulis]
MTHRRPYKHQRPYHYLNGLRVVMHTGTGDTCPCEKYLESREGVYTLTMCPGVSMSLIDTCLLYSTNPQAVCCRANQAFDEAMSSTPSDGRPVEKFSIGGGEIVAKQSWWSQKKITRRLRARSSDILVQSKRSESGTRHKITFLNTDGPVLTRSLTVLYLRKTESSMTEKPPSRASISDVPFRFLDEIIDGDTFTGDGVGHRTRKDSLFLDAKYPQPSSNRARSIPSDDAMAILSEFQVGRSETTRMCLAERSSLGDYSTEHKGGFDRRCDDCTEDERDVTGRRERGRV